MEDPRTIAYFSMELAVSADVPTYAGGLGILAGDTVRAAADLGVPMVAVTLVHRKGYFRQQIDADGGQIEIPERWALDELLEELAPRATVTIERREVQIRAWCFRVHGAAGATVPVYFLDTDLPENDARDRALTDCLYGGDQRYRLAQEVILGIGGVRMLHALGHNAIERFHMNEGHAALLTLELLDDEARRTGRETVCQETIERTREKCVFTTHTAVAAGHDQFPMELVSDVVGPRESPVDLKDRSCAELVRRVLDYSAEIVDDLRALVRPGVSLNMTYLALNLSRYVNGVAVRHGEVSRRLFAGYEIDSITNGVHPATWAAPATAELFDRRIPTWRTDHFSLRYALSIPADEIREAHRRSKACLLDHVRRETSVALDKDVLTIGFARRMTQYKRPGLVFEDLDRLRRIAREVGRLQIVVSGKAHPRDWPGKELIRRIQELAEALRGDVIVVFVPNYEMTAARLLTSGVDLWLNTPQPPMEASGTSGMKAAINGVPSLSVLDGWWIEGCIEGVTGWAIGDRQASVEPLSDSRRDAAALYDKLERVVMPAFYSEDGGYVDVMRHAMALNGSFFNTHRMVQQYVVKAYL